MNTILLTKDWSVESSRERPYQQCTRTVMDTSDPLISFNEKGECNHCEKFDNILSEMWHPNEEGKKQLEIVVDQMKKEGKGKDYDCIIGLSGGVDSAYLAYQASKMGLRILAVHVDGGWNSELAVKNIENIVSKCGIDLFTHVVDWESMQDLQRAFFRSGLANQDVPQDHAYFAALYNFAVKNKVEWVLHGGNIATESVLPESWGYNAMDAKHLKGIHKKYGKSKLANYPIVSLFSHYYYYPHIKKMKSTRMLNLMKYDKEEAIKVLEEELDFKYYGGKHYESRFTRFFQAHYLPNRFGFDKRKAHMSSLILSGQMSRKDALEELKRPLYNKQKLEEDRDYVIKKLDISLDEYETIMSQPIRTYKDFPSNEKLLEKMVKLKSIIKKLTLSN